MQCTMQDQKIHPIHPILLHTIVDTWLVGWVCDLMISTMTGTKFVKRLSLLLFILLNCSKSLWLMNNIDYEHLTFSIPVFLWGFEMIFNAAPSIYPRVIRET